MAQVGIHTLPVPAALRHLKDHASASPKPVNKWFAASCSSDHHLTERWLLQAYMEGALAQVGIHTLPVPPALQHLEEHQNASSKRHLQEFDKICALVEEREQLGLVCRPFPPKVSVHDQDTSLVDSYTDSLQHDQDMALPESYTRTQQQNTDTASTHSDYLDSQPQTQDKGRGHSYPESQQQKQLDALSGSHTNTQQPKRDQAAVPSYQDSQQQKQDEALSESYSQQQKWDEVPINSYLESQQQTQSGTPISSYLDRQQQQQQQKQDEAPFLGHFNSQLQQQDEAPVASYTNSHQQRQNGAFHDSSLDSQLQEGDFSAQSYTEPQQPNAEEPVAQPQRLSRSQQQALLRKRTGKATRSRLELIMQVAKNRKEAAAQKLDDASAPES